MKPVKPYHSESSFGEFQQLFRPACGFIRGGVPEQNVLRKARPLGAATGWGDFRPPQGRSGFVVGGVLHASPPPVPKASVDRKWPFPR